jgi:hypothetical protein
VKSAFFIRKTRIHAGPAQLAAKPYNPDFGMVSAGAARQRPAPADSSAAFTQTQ